MKFEIYTLVDITRTDARRGNEPDQYKKQQNYLTVLNTLGMRANPTVNKYPVVTENHPSFGTSYKNIKKVWKLEFDIEYEDATSVELMTIDFVLVPIITGLGETVKFKDDVFVPNDAKLNNIVFVRIE